MSPGNIPTVHVIEGETLHFYTHTSAMCKQIANMTDLDVIKIAEILKH